MNAGQIAVERESQLIMGSDGTILATTGHWPPGLVDLRLESCAHVSPALREAGRVLLQELRGSRDRVRTSTIVEEGARVQLVAIEALAIRRAPTDLRRLLASKLDVLSSQAAAADSTVTVAVADDVPAAVRVDAEKVAWAVTTLVGNALRYLCTRSRRFGGERIDVRAGFDATTATVAIEVQDDGPGIPADTVARLFQRDGLNVRGSGLAVLLMSDICAAHGGTVEVRSSTKVSDHGTTVRLTFPVR